MVKEEKELMAKTKKKKKNLLRFHKNVSGVASESNGQNRS